jgi:uncharacterized protein
MINFEEIKKVIIDKLDKELPSYLSYHNITHTLRVIEQATIIAEAENINASDIELLKLAALFHDTGFTKTYKGHEEESCNIAETELKKMNISNADIQKIKGMIMATQIPQSPKNKLEMILADADLEYLGTDDFIRIGNNLFKELQELNPEFNLMQWNELQRSFFNTHSYFTDYCKNYKEPKKQQNIIDLTTL